MSGLPIYLTGVSLWLNGQDVSQWTKAGSVRLRDVDGVAWELDLTLDVMPHGAANPDPAYTQRQWWARHQVEHPDCSEGRYPHDEHIAAYRGVSS